MDSLRISAEYTLFVRKVLAPSSGCGVVRPHAVSLASHPEPNRPAAFIDHNRSRVQAYFHLVRSAPLLIALTLSALPCHGADQAIEGAHGIVATIDQKSGHYEVRSRELNWTFAGQLGESASNLSIKNGQDRLGVYRELRFTWSHPVPLSGTIRTYASRPVVLFGITSKEPIADAAAIRFPRFTEFPKDLHHFSYQNDVFAPRSFTLEETGTPWLLFDDQMHAAVLSPAANHMIARMRGDGIMEIASGLNEGVANLPAGFTHQTLLAFDVGVNAAWDSWGTALTDLQGKHRPSNDADIGLRYLGYWTDNGAAYWYNYEQGLGYAGTLETLVQRYREEGIPLRYLQLDSWWYSKTLTGPGGESLKPNNPQLPAEEWNRYGGLLTYEAHPTVFPGGLATFQKKIGLPLITHNRWIDPASPYHTHYDISGVAAVDPRFWKEIMDYTSSANVVTYEQDWLNVIYKYSPALGTALSAGDAFTDGMARAAQEKGMSMQYCMALPRHFLQGARYGNLTTIRTSGDRFTRSKWDAFLYTSRLASALGIWPWTDVFMSTETDNVLIATLSGGMVGNGDKIGAENKDNLLRAARLDGVIVKPDAPLLPIDAMYASDALGMHSADGSRSPPPMIASAHTDHGALRTAYVFAYSRGPDDVKAVFTPAQVGILHDSYLYDTQGRTARRLAASDKFTFDLAPDSTAYFVLTPVSSAGVALFGDDGKFVPDGRKRIASIVEERNRLTVTLTFAPQETAVRLFGYAMRRPAITAQTGSAGDVTFDERTGRFEVSVSPSPERVNERPGNDLVQHAIVSIQGE
jgi:hypothetical protein